ncbi:hypothetical protein DVK05_09970 [Halorubrum sp. Atlit-8R]|uniref:hypothetical protein n=1 Tax=Halorubrum sp. Atlit-8R TaxID=2282126 RepID=UPI000EF2003E|nr:hypothetical protein [Halorubrum sp. Atlit-8R]RLM81312.1 hypothetical protein DVK05_09970 [Halorubrum sp. Atlit-8R]
MSIFEDIYEVWYQAGSHRDHVTGRCEADTLLEALQAVDATTGADVDITEGDAVVVLDRESAATISERLGDDVHVTRDDPLVPREHVYLVPRRIEQRLPGKTQVHTVESSSPWGLAMVPSCVNYDNEVIDTAGVVGISWVVDDE